jgi:hypothetical protein
MMNSASWHSMDRPIYKAFPNYDYTVLWTSQNGIPS